MALIFWFSSMPDQNVSLAAQPFIAKIPQAIHVIPSAKPLQIQWLKVGHFIGYFWLGLAYLWALRPSTPRAWALAILLSAAYAVTDEIHQSLIPGRSASPKDVLLDTLAAVLSILLVVQLPRLKNPSRISRTQREAA